MELNKVAIAALLFIILIVVVNFAMYGIARGAAKGGNSRWLGALRDSLSKPMEGSSNKSMDELRKQIEELENKEKKE